MKDKSTARLFGQAMVFIGLTCTLVGIWLNSVVPFGIFVFVFLMMLAYVNGMPKGGGDE